MTAADIAQQLVASQRLTHRAARAEHTLLRDPALDTPMERMLIAAMHTTARQAAGQFAVFIDFFTAANDEPLLIDQP